jgi:hypothetical protein
MSQKSPKKVNSTRGLWPGRSVVPNTARALGIAGQVRGLTGLTGLTGLVGGAVWSP